MKKIISLVLILAVALSFSACGLSFDVGSDSLEISQEESEKKMEELAAKDGYEITFKCNNDGEEEENYTYGRKGDFLWLLSGEDYGTAFKYEGNKTHVYNLSEEGWEYTETVSNENEDYAYVKEIYSSWLYFGNTYDGMLKKGGNVKIAGRDCTEYSFKMSLIIASVEYNVAVDNEYGLTMKLEIKASAEGETNAAGLEVTKFVTGSSVNVPDLPAPVENED